jgi:hypothetical protein
VFISDPEIVEGSIGEMEDVEVIVQSRFRGHILDMIEPDDLVIAPAHVIHDAPASSSRKVAARLSNTNLAVIAGPHRLSISKGMTRYDVQSVTHPRL